jgi:hypothetical protein
VVVVGVVEGGFGLELSLQDSYHVDALGVTTWADLGHGGQDSMLLDRSKRLNWERMARLG